MDLKRIIRTAMNEEDFFRDFYREAASRAMAPSAKALLERLSSEEKVHKEKLQSFDFRSLKLHDTREEPPEFAKALMLTPVDEFQKVKEVFQFAVKTEGMTRKRYASLAKMVDDDNARWLFNLLAVEEQRHERLLAQELKRMSV